MFVMYLRYTVHCTTLLNPVRPVARMVYMAEVRRTPSLAGILGRSCLQPRPEPPLPTPPVQPHWSPCRGRLSAARPVQQSWWSTSRPDPNLQLVRGAALPRPRMAELDHPHCLVFSFRLDAVKPWWRLHPVAILPVVVWRRAPAVGYSVPWSWHG